MVESVVREGKAAAEPSFLRESNRLAGRLALPQNATCWAAGHITGGSDELQRRGYV